MTPKPGDIVTIGSPAGVGFGMYPKVFWKPGDEIETSVTGMGFLRHSVVVHN